MFKSKLLFRATALRKYLSTIIQVMALPKYQKKWIANHLGHSQKIQDLYYRQSLDSIETAKIAKLMFLVDHCRVSAAAGDNLDTIDRFITHDEISKAVPSAKQQVKQANISVYCVRKYLILN